MLTVGSVSWILGHWILFPRNGIEAYDDALHILAAMQEPDGAFFYHQFPWHWHTRPLYLISGEDIGNFRVAGWVILAVSSALLGRSLLSLTSSRNHWTVTSAIPVTIILAIGTLTYYSGMFRTPSYNWVTLVGGLIFCSGFFYFISARRRESTWVAPEVWVSMLVSSFGVFFSLPSKPSTALFLWMLAVLVLPKFGMLHLIPSFTLGLVSGSVFWFLLSRLLGIWPPQALDVLWGAASRDRTHDYNFFPDCTINQSDGVARAFERLICVPERFAIDIANQPRMLITIFLAGIVLFSVGKVLAWRGDVLAKLGALVLVMHGLISAASPSFSFGNYDAAQRWVLSEQTTGAVLMWLGMLAFTSPPIREPVSTIRYLAAPSGVLCGLALFRLNVVPSDWSIFLAWAVAVLLVFHLGGTSIFAVPMVPRGSGRVPWPKIFQADSWASYFWTSAALVSVMFVVGFGSSLGPYRVAPIATVFGLAGATLLVLQLSSRRARQIGLATLISGSALISSLVVADGHAQPWGMEPLRGQNDKVVLLSQHSPLFFDEESATSYRTMIAAAQQRGWERGTPLIDFSRWGLIGSLILDAEVPPSLTLSLDWQAGVSGSNLVLAQEAGFDFRAAWVLTSDHEFIAADQPEKLEAVISSYNLQSGVNFPDNFDLVSDVGGFSLWKPKMP